MRQATILCVDDEPSILDSLHRLFRKEGYELLLAVSGEEALQILEERPVDLILTDYGMPGLTGVELLHYARVKQPEAIRIVMSGYTDLYAITSAINEGEIYRFIPKPWNNEELKMIVRHSLEQARLAARNKELSEAIAKQDEQLRELNDKLELKRMERTEGFILKIEHLLLSHQVLNDLPIAIVGIDDRGRIVLLNKRANSLCLFDGKLALGKLYEDLLPDGIQELIKTTLASGQVETLPERTYGGLSLRVTCSPFGPNGGSSGILLALDELYKKGGGS